MSDLILREATEPDLPAIWPIFHSIMAAGETYAIDPNSDAEDFRRIWFELPLRCIIAERQGAVLGSYYLKPNAAGPGSHVCNCGYIVAPEARGQGLARLMCLHSQDLARELGFLAMQFNAVVANNSAAVALWGKLGFATMGRVPGAFDHPRDGLTDILVMHKWLVPPPQGRNQAAD